eukprot:sb/3468757/
MSNTVYPLSFPDHDRLPGDDSLRSLHSLIMSVTISCPTFGHVITAIEHWHCSRYYNTDILSTTSSIHDTPPVFSDQTMELLKVSADIHNTSLASPTQSLVFLGCTLPCIEAPGQPNRPCFVCDKLFDLSSGRKGEIDLSPLYGRSEPKTLIFRDVNGTAESVTVQLQPGGVFVVEGGSHQEKLKTRASPSSLPPLPLSLPFLSTSPSSLQVSVPRKHLRASNSRPGHMVVTSGNTTHLVAANAMMLRSC